MQKIKNKSLFKHAETFFGKKMCNESLQIQKEDQGAMKLECRLSKVTEGVAIEENRNFYARYVSNQ